MNKSFDKKLGKICERIVKKVVGKSYEYYVLWTKIVNESFEKKLGKKKLWVKFVNKSFWKFWEKVADKSCEQKFWTGVMNNIGNTSLKPMLLNKFLNKSFN